MKPLLKTILKLGIFFTSILILGKLTGLLSVDAIQSWFERIQEQPKIYLIALAAGLLFMDLFVTIPTLTICLFAGNFIGFPGAFIACLLGTSSAGMTGYWLSRKYGQKLMPFLLKDEKERVSMQEAFSQYSNTMILLSRAMPMLPEVSACLSGMTRKSFAVFALVWHLSSIPYIAIATYAGSISSFEDPKPAIFAAIGILAFFWVSWILFVRSPVPN